MWTNQRNKELRDRAAKVIPGGMYGHQSTAILPDVYPQFFRRAEGTRLWDTDGNEYIDYMCAFGPNLLGYRHPSVEDAATTQQRLCDTATGPSEIMVELAERFVSMISHADWAMFCKNGTDATTMAMMCARAHTKKRKILAAKKAYHGAAPWCNPYVAGTVPEERAHMLYYEYNNPQSLEDAFRAAGDDVAGVFASAFRHDVFEDQELPTPEFAQSARDLCDRTGALLIVDDVRAGFRLARDCSWSTVGIQPDLSAWGKCIANGYPLSALLGSEKARAAAQKIFVTGSFWFQAIPMAAAIATLNQIQKTDYLERMEKTGAMLRSGLATQASSHGFSLRQTGPVQMPMILFDDDPDMRLGYGWVSEALTRGVYIHPWHNNFICAALTENDVKLTLEITDEAFAALKKKRATLGPVPQLAARFARLHDESLTAAR
ncbi:MAG: aminotransferase class III-fold pyridoxal phosphate-dependent enzyme [Acidobacteriia bacterium]|nr:aminotransferase class III-fold pyridoxal phosphate-dependent enzyme [Terriglobia bacterium]